jgi:hypothetical protein
MTPDTVNISDFPSFTSGVLAEFCRKWPGTDEACAARLELLNRKALPYNERCRSPWECVGKGYCPRDPNCGD